MQLLMQVISFFACSSSSTERSEEILLAPEEYARTCAVAQAQAKAAAAA